MNIFVCSLELRYAIVAENFFLAKFLQTEYIHLTQRPQRFFYNAFFFVKIRVIRGLLFFDCSQRLRYE
jgi:hypothetical protein